MLLSCPALADSESISVLRTHGGIIDISAPRTDEAPPTNNEKCKPLLVIRNQHEYEDLLRRIPTQGISQRSPAPKNDDPLLHKPRIDFTKLMLVVVARASMDAPKIRRVIRKEGKIVIDAEFPDNSLPRPYGTGTYSAVLIPFSKEKVVVQARESGKKDDETPQQAPEARR